MQARSRLLLSLIAIMTALGCDDGPNWQTGLDSGGDADSDSDSDSDADSDSDTDPDCTALDAFFDDAWTDFEDQVLVLTNEARAQGASCGSEGTFPPAPPLAMQDQLRKAARRHSWHMGDAGYFSHDSPGGPCGDDLVERCETAGYTGWYAIGENIAAGYQNPTQVVQGWLDSDGHCANIMSSSYQHIGIGYAFVPESPSQYQTYWTQDFGAN